MSIITFELEMAPKVIWEGDVVRPDWWGTNWDIDFSEFDLWSDHMITGLDTLVLAPQVTLDASFVTANGTWSYYTWTNGSTGEMIWDLTTLSPFDSGYVGATFDYVYSSNSWSIPGTNYMTGTVGTSVPAPGAIALMAVALCATLIAGRTR